MEYSSTQLQVLNFFWRENYKCWMTTNFSQTKILMHRTPTRQYIIEFRITSYHVTISPWLIPFVIQRCSILKSFSGFLDKLLVSQIHRPFEFLGILYSRTKLVPFDLELSSNVNSSRKISCNRTYRNSVPEIDKTYRKPAPALVQRDRHLCQRLV